MKSVIRRQNAPGFTLIELLVVVAIIAVLIALLLPAVQAVRSSAARSQCENNLKQMGLALHQYAGASGNGAFPPGGVASKVSLFQSWMMLILPYVEQSEIYEQLLASTYAAGAVPIKTYYCPADPNGILIDGAPDWGFPNAPRSPAAMTDYVGISGPDIFSPTGIFGWYDGKPLRIVNVTDGTSNTVMIGEKPYIPPPAAGTLNNSTFDAWNEDQTLGYAMGVYYANPMNRQSDTTSGIHNTSTMVFQNLQNSPCSTPSSGRYDFGQGPNNPSNFCSYNYLYSGHKNGANFCLADGSVRFVNYSISPTTLSAASTYAGNDMPGSDW